MCGRYTLRRPSTEIAEVFGLFEDVPLEPRYNIAPTQMVAAVRVDPIKKRRETPLLKRGLVPAWANHPFAGNRRRQRGAREQNDE